jgi:hypothetical protein
MAMHLLFDAPYVPVLAKVGVNLVGVTALYLGLRQGFAARTSDFLAAQVTAGALTGSQAADLASRGGRRRALQGAEPGAERELLRGQQQTALAELDAAAA